MTLQIESTSSENTEAIAAQIGERLKGGETIVLASDLGGGKTTFVRGLARGARSMDTVASPTFTISKIYKAGALEIHHFDFYRLQDAGVVAHELHDVVGDPQIVVVIEWGAIVEDVVPNDCVRVSVVRTGDTSRTLNFEYPDSLSYLMEGIC